MKEAEFAAIKPRLFCDWAQSRCVSEGEGTTADGGRRSARTKLIDAINITADQ